MKRKADEISESEMKDLLRKYLLPMSQEQMMELLINIGSENAAAFEEIENTAEQDPEARKVFVRDLPRGCSKEDLEAALAEAFGGLAELSLPVDRVSGNHKGYAFATFEKISQAIACAKSGELEFEGRAMKFNLASERKKAAGGGAAAGAGSSWAAAPAPAAAAGGQGPDGSDESARKLFVYGLDWHTEEDEFRAYFAQWGELEDVRLVRNKESGKCKGFGFATYMRAAGAANALGQRGLRLKGRDLKVQLAALGKGGDGLQQAAGGGGGGALLQQQPQQVVLAQGGGGFANLPPGAQIVMVPAGAAGMGMGQDAAAAGGQMMMVQQPQMGGGGMAMGTAASGYSGLGGGMMQQQMQAQQGMMMPGQQQMLQGGGALLGGGMSMGGGMM